MKMGRHGCGVLDPETGSLLSLIPSHIDGCALARCRPRHLVCLAGQELTGPVVGVKSVKHICERWATRIQVGGPAEGGVLLPTPWDLLYDQKDFGVLVFGGKCSSRCIKQIDRP